MLVSLENIKFTSSEYIPVHVLLNNSVHHLLFAIVLVYIMGLKIIYPADVGSVHVTPEY